jgi:hypothetical protein
MKKLAFFALVLVLSQTLVCAASCPLTSYERFLDYKDGYSASLRCGYASGKLSFRMYTYHGSGNTSYSITVDYYSDGMLKEYTYRGSNMGGGYYSENKSYNPSGMLIKKDVINGRAGYSCTYAGNYRLRCEDYDGTYYESVEYASQYEGN